jgi:hypothetical protein
MPWLQNLFAIIEGNPNGVNKNAAARQLATAVDPASTSSERDLPNCATLPCLLIALPQVSLPNCVSSCDRPTGWCEQPHLTASKQY